MGLAGTWHVLGEVLGEVKGSEGVVQLPLEAFCSAHMLWQAAGVPTNPAGTVRQGVMLCGHTVAVLACESAAQAARRVLMCMP